MCEQWKRFCLTGSISRVEMVRCSCKAVGVIGHRSDRLRYDPTNQIGTFHSSRDTSELVHYSCRVSLQRVLRNSALQSMIMGVRCTMSDIIKQAANPLGSANGDKHGNRFAICFELVELF